MSRKKHACLLLLLAVPALGGAAGPNASGDVGAAITAITSLTISPTVPVDIPGGAPNASLADAARFAWQEFIALNWPALAGKRDVPDGAQPFGAANVPLVWQTFRNKVEIYPGTGAPHGYAANKPDLGYNDPPRYIYSSTPDPNDPTDNPGIGGPYPGLAPGQVPACPGQGAVPQPAWVNLDEATQIGLDTMYAGAGPSGTPGQQFLFLAKANHVEYDYVVPKSWYDGVNDTQGLSGTIAPIAAATQSYLAQYKKNPPAGSSQYVSFPNGTIEVKSAWRQLTQDEARNGRWVTARARYYELQSNGRYPCWREATFGLAALHIIHKTPSAPYFVFATFGQADNLKNRAGQVVENDDGKIINPPSPQRFLSPEISSKNATSANPANASSIQALTPKEARCTEPERGQKLYYKNTPGTPTPQGPVCVDQRRHSIPAEVIAVNQQAHGTLQSYLRTPDSPWLHYKLVNVQSKPIDKPTPGQDYRGPDAATYYLANIVVETDYNLQTFSGQFQAPLNKPNQNVPTSNLITDWSNSGARFHNLYHAGNQYNMGGCMGCHGNAQVTGGTDFSFILLFQRDFQPDHATGTGGQLLSVPKYLVPLTRRSAQ